MYAAEGKGVQLPKGNRSFIAYFHQERREKKGTKDGYRGGGTIAKNTVGIVCSLEQAGAAQPCQGGKDFISFQKNPATDRGGGCAPVVDTNGRGNTITSEKGEELIRRYS